MATDDGLPDANISISPPPPLAPPSAPPPGVPKSYVKMTQACIEALQASNGHDFETLVSACKTRDVSGLATAVADILFPQHGQPSTPERDTIVKLLGLDPDETDHCRFPNYPVECNKCNQRGGVFYAKAQKQHPMIFDARCNRCNVESVREARLKKKMTKVQSQSDQHIHPAAEPRVPKSYVKMTQAHIERRKTRNYHGFDFEALVSRFKTRDISTMATAVADIIFPQQGQPPPHPERETIMKLLALDGIAVHNQFPNYPTKCSKCKQSGYFRGRYGRDDFETMCGKCIHRRSIEIRHHRQQLHRVVRPPTLARAPTPPNSSTTRPALLYFDEYDAWKDIDADIWTQMQLCNGQPGWTAEKQKLLDMMKQRRRKIQMQLLEMELETVHQEISDAEERAVVSTLAFRFV